METASILIPCYNDEEYVGTAIESALNQTWPDCEIIVVDDGSDDDSTGVVQQYESDGVKVLEQENRGAAAARNRALQASTGDYIQYLDADDLLHPCKIEAQISALQGCAKRTVAVCSTVYFQDGTPPEEGEQAKGVDQIPWLTSKDPVQWLINLWMPGAGWGMVGMHAWLVPRGVAEEAGLWKEHLSLDDDGEYFARVVLASEGVRYVRRGCVYYRQHDGPRVSAKNSESAFESWLHSIDWKRDHLMARVAEEECARAAARGLARQYWSLALNAYPDYPEVATVAETRATDMGHPAPHRTVSDNGWKGIVAQVVESLLGWRAARWLQQKYHRTRREVIELLPLQSSASLNEL